MSDHYFSRRPGSRGKLGLIRCRLRGFEFEFYTSSGVFSSRRVDNGTRLLVESMELPEGGLLLDMGCGYGVIGIVAARLRPELTVYMTDVNERAMGLAERSAERNRVANVVVQAGDLYGPVEGLAFDGIVSNPPISAGLRAVVGPLVAGAADRLVEGGSLQVVVQSNKGGRSVAGLMEGAFGGVEVVARGGGYRVLRSVRVSPGGV